MTARGIRPAPGAVVSDDLHVPGAEPRRDRRPARSTREPDGQIARLEAWLKASDIPTGTFETVRAAGQGPRTFVTVRRIYVHRDDWHAWCRRMAESGGVRLNERRQAEA